MPDCIVVGGGIIGMLSARELALAGREVVLLERGQLGREASWASAGVLSPLYPWQVPLPLHALVSWSQTQYGRLVSDLAADTGIDAEWTPSGLLMFDTECEAEAAAWAQGTGERVVRLEPEEVRALEPAATETAAGALWFPAVAQIRNPRLLQAARMALERSGVRIVEHAKALSVLISGSEVHGVATTRGEFHAQSVVISGGAWSGALLGGTGYRLPIVPVRGQMILFRAQPGLLCRILLRQDCYLVPRRDGHILVGSTVEHAGFDKSVTEDARLGLRAWAAGMVPALAGYPIEKHWAGLRPGTADGLPYIGPHPELKGLYVNAGHFRNGVAAAPASARLLADLMLRREPIIVPAPFALANRA